MNGKLEIINNFKILKCFNLNLINLLLFQFNNIHNKFKCNSLYHNMLILLELIIINCKINEDLMKYTFFLIMTIIDINSKKHLKIF